MMLTHNGSDFRHFIDQIRASLVPVRYFNATVLSVTIGVSALEIRDHTEECLEEGIKITVEVWKVEESFLYFQSGRGFSFIVLLIVEATNEE